MSLIIGIDTGVSGAVAVLTEEYQVKHVFDMPTFELETGSGAKRRWVDDRRLPQALGNDESDYAHAFVEWTWPRPNDGRVQAFAFGDAHGVVRGILATLGVPSTRISPQRWKKDLAVGKGKDASRARASELMPSGSQLWFAKGAHGRADAALIAYWGVRSFHRIAKG